MAIFMYMKEPSGPAIMSYLYTLVGNYLEPLVAITILACDSCIYSVDRQ